MKIYLMIVLLVTMFVVNVGGLLPMLISSSSTELVILGFINIILFLPLNYFVIMKLCKSVKKLNTKEELV